MGKVMFSQQGGGLLPELHAERGGGLLPELHAERGGVSFLSSILGGGGGVLLPELLPETRHPPLRPENQPPPDQTPTHPD